MKKILFSFLVLAGFSVNAQVTGSKTIGIDYTTLDAAFADLNATGVGAGGATINIPAGYTANSPLGGFQLGSVTLNASLSSTNQLIIKKSGAGANPLFTASVGTVAITAANLVGDAVFYFSGVDYMTIDGIDLQDNPANIDAIALVERGFVFYNLDANDGANNNTVKNSTITFLKNLNNYATGIYFAHFTASSLGTAVVPTALSGTNSNNKIYGNTISKGALQAIYFAGYGAPAPYTLYDQDNDIGGISPAQGNTIVDFGGVINSGFYITNTAIIAINQNNTNISYNTIQFGTGGLGTIGVQVVGVNSTFTVSRNTINATGQSYNTNPNISTHAGIVNQSAGALLTAQFNAISITSVPYNGTTSNPVYGIFSSSNGSLNAQRNTILNGASPAAFYGIFSSALTNASIINNEISGCSTVGAASNVSGVFLAATATSGTVAGNKIYNLTASGATGSAYGLFIGGVTTNTSTNIYNNVIGDLKTPAVSSTAVSLSGIYLASTGATSTLNVFYNTINLNGTSSGANFNSAGIFHTNNATATTAALNLTNNIIVNSSTPNGTGSASALRRSAAGVSNYAATSNNNNFFGTTAVYWNGAAGNTLAQLQALSRDANSLNINPSFITVVGSSSDFLKLNPANVTTQNLDNKGVPLLGYTLDYNGLNRSATTPDIGAYEFLYVAPTTIPTCTILATPANLSTGALPNPTNLTWNAAANATSYKLTIGTATGLSDVLNVSGITLLSYSAQLLPNTQYFVKVVASNLIGDATGCVETSFTTGNLVYCSPSPAYSNIEPTTNVTFGSINNTTSAVVGGTPAYEDFSSSVTPAIVNREAVIPISLNANTDGATYDHFFAVFIDWNQDGDFDDANEKYFTTVPTFIKVTGSDGTGTPATGSITVPADAKLGFTRMRVKSAFYGATGPATEPNLSNFANGCVTTGSSFGQIEDYKIQVDNSLSTVSAIRTTIGVYPNPFQDVLNISNVDGVKSISINDITGRQVKTMKASNQLEVSDLKTGLYIVNLNMEDGSVRSIKAIKK